ncbi:hypothetical protein ACQPZJ_37890 [Actinoplanes sp. CA-054009]
METDYAVKLDPRLEQVGVLMEPTTVVAKAWEQVEKVGQRSWFEPERLLGDGTRCRQGRIRARGRDTVVGVWPNVGPDAALIETGRWRPNRA